MVIHKVDQKRPSFIINILHSASGGVVAALLAVIGMPIISRIYPPDAYAIWALIMSVAFLGSTIATLRYDLAIVLPKRHETAINVLALACSSAFISALILLAIILLFGESFSSFVGDKAHQAELFFIPLFVAASGTYQSFLTWFTRLKKFHYVSIAIIATATATICAQICTGIFFGPTPKSLVIGSVTGQFVGISIYITLFFKAGLGGLIKKISSKRITLVSKKYWYYPRYMTLYTVIGSVQDRLVLWIINLYGTTTSVGMYSFSNKILSYPVSFLTSAIRPVIFQRTASLGVLTNEKLIVSLNRLLLTGFIPFWVLFVFYAEEVFSIVFGDEWRDAGTYARILSFPFCLMILNNWMDRLFDVMGKQKLALKLQIIKLCVTILPFTIYAALSHQIINAIILFSFCQFLFLTFWIITLYRVANFKIESLIYLAVETLKVIMVSGITLFALKALFSDAVVFTVYLSIAALLVAVRSRKNFQKLIEII